MAVSLAFVSHGILIGYSSIALPDLKLNEDQASWFVSIDHFVSALCCPLGGLISGWIGRKKILMCFTPFAIFAWVLIAIHTTAEWMLFTGRILSSIAITLMIATPSNFSNMFQFYF